MRIFVTFHDRTGTSKTSRLNVEECTTTTHLLKMISAQFKIKKQYIIAKLKHQTRSLRITQNWPLVHYPFKNGSRVAVESIRQHSQQILNSPINLANQLAKIDQQLQLQLEPEYQPMTQNQRQYDKQWLKYLDRSLTMFLEAVRQRSLEKIAELLKEEPSVHDESNFEQMFHKKNKYLLDELGECGKSAIHWAIHQKDLDMVQFLLIKSCNPNTISLDQYSPLQLAIILKQSTIFQTLISHPKIQINQVTAKGTALHLAIQNRLMEFVEKLISCGADLQIVDNNGKSPLKLGEQLKLKITNINTSEKRFQIPYIGRGKVFKVTSISYRLKQRLLLINPFSNQLIVYNQQKQIEHNIKINKIKTAYRLQNRTWLMKKDYTYFQIITADNFKLLFAVRNQAISDKWIDQIHTAHAFTSSKIQIKVEKEQQLIETIDDAKNQIKLNRIKNNNMPKKNQSKMISIFDIKPANQDENQSGTQKNVYQIQNKEKEKSKDENQKYISELQTSSILIHSENQDNAETDLRESDILGSVIDTQKFLTPPRKPSDNYYDSFRSSLLDPPQHPQVSFRDFQILRQLGNGAFGKVFLARHEKTQKLYALKVLNKKKLIVKKQLKYAVRQANILKKVNHPYVIKLHYSFQTPNNLYMALDYCPYGDLAQLLCDEVRLSEDACRFYIAQLILAIEYLHKNKIIYRDLKPENILIARNGFMRLTDFGLSKQNNFSMSFCGSPAYLSPEMLQKKGVGFQSDIYGIGCVLYEMLVGQPPYFDDNIDTLLSNIQDGKLKFPSFLSKPAKSLITGLLQRNLKKRIGVKNIKEVKDHDFFTNFQWDQLQNSQMKLPLQLGNKLVDSETSLEVISEHGFNDIDYESSYNMINRIKGFTFIQNIQGV